LCFQIFEFLDILFSFVPVTTVSSSIGFCKL